jgi:DNA integrity scanning protein DisA with diadenylate cyclase activity
MRLRRQTTAILEAARQLIQSLPADAVLLLAETDLDWEAVRKYLDGCPLLVAAQDKALSQQLAAVRDLTVIEIDAGPTPTDERMSLVLLEAVRTDLLHNGAHVVVLYNGIEVGQDEPEQIDSLSVIHLGEHLERLSSQDLRQLDTHVPLETLRAVVDLATEIGREGREGHPVGTLFVVGDTRKVLTMCKPLNFNPFRGYNRAERDVRDPKVREQIKDLAQLEGAILIRRDGVAVAACMYVNAPAEGITLSKGLGTRHWSAAAVSRKTKAVAVTVSQSTGTVRIFQDGEVVLRIEALARPMTYRHIRLEAQDADGQARSLVQPVSLPNDPPPTVA